MQGLPQTSAAPAAPQYPPGHLADLAVCLLAGLAGNHFTPQTALSTAPSSTRAVRAQRGCCIVGQLPAAPLPLDIPFYFGKDKAGYVIVSPRTTLPDWPTTRGGVGKPVRLTRWLTLAPPGSVVRHTCDHPACIRASHLTVSSQAENLADAVRRGRRKGVNRYASSTLREALRSNPLSPAAPVTIGSSAQRAREARFGLTGFVSPSKIARRAARIHLHAASGGRSCVPLARALHASAAPEQVCTSENQTRPHSRP